MWQPPERYFQVDPPAPAAQWGLPSPWVQPTDDYRNDVNKKKEYGIALAKQGAMDLSAAFKAGCEVFPDNTNRALWVAHNWLNDAVVVAARDLYADSVRKEPEILDKDQFASRVLECAEEKRLAADGKLYPAIEAKDKLGFLRLYAEIKGYVGKNETNNSFNFTNNSMQVKLVKPDPISKTIEHDQEITPQLEAPSSHNIKLKLVK